MLSKMNSLLAIMLGRLKMSVKECIAEYEVVMKEVFPAGAWKTVRFARGKAFYDEKPLENAIKRIVAKKLNDSDAKLLDEDESNPCKM